MPRFADARDMATLFSFNDELVREVISEQVGYYKISTQTKTNMYGEAEDPIFETARLIVAMVNPDPTRSTNRAGLPETDKSILVTFFQPHLEEAQLFPEMGDILYWHGRYYQISNVNTNSFPFQLDPRYSLSPETEGYGASWTVVVSAHVISPEKYGLEKTTQ